MRVLTLLVVTISSVAFFLSGQLLAQSQLSITWTDPAREREVPVKIYLPKDASKPAPVIIFSHGLGGSRDGYSYVGKHWASEGFVVIHPQHVGSDTSIFRNIDQKELQKIRREGWLSTPESRQELLQRVVTGKETGVGGKAMLATARGAISFKTITDRIADVKFVLDTLEAQNNDAKSPLAGRLDMARIGMAGHSFGANTTMLLAGQKLDVPLVDLGDVTDPRIKAAIAMSPPVALNPATYADAYGPIKSPLMIMTGTEDNSPISRTANADRGASFPFLINTPAAYLVTFNGGDHGVFSGSNRSPAKQKADVRFVEIILESSTHFWNAYLRDDVASATWMSDGSFEKEMGKAGTLKVAVK